MNHVFACFAPLMSSNIGVILFLQKVSQSFDNSKCMIFIDDNSVEYDGIPAPIRLGKNHSDDHFSSFRSPKRDVIAKPRGGFFGWKRNFEWFFLCGRIFSHSSSIEYS